MAKGALYPHSRRAQIRSSWHNGLFVVAKKTETKSEPRTEAKAEGSNSVPTQHEPIRPPSGDIALVWGKDGDGVHILRRRSEEAPIEAGLLRPMREGKPIDGEVVSLTQRDDHPMIYDVKSEFQGPNTAFSGASVPGERLSGDGPAQVASDAYRKGWDAVWGRRRDRSIN